MGRYEGLVKPYKSKNPFFPTHRSTHHPQASCHVSSGRESPTVPDRILDAPHLSISWCMDYPSAQWEHWGHSGQDFTAGQSLPVHGQPSVNVPGGGSFSSKRIPNHRQETQSGRPLGQRDQDPVLSPRGAPGIRALGVLQSSLLHPTSVSTSQPTPDPP